jgi:hypothetical protein
LTDLEPALGNEVHVPVTLARAVDDLARAETDLLQKAVNTLRIA